MKPTALWKTLIVVCILGSQAYAQGPACSDHVSPCDRPAAVPTGAMEAVHSKPYLGNGERCPDISVDVASPSAEERNIACSAARDAVQLLGACGIPLREVLKLQITNEVRHPFSKEPIFGFFDISQQRVHVIREARIGSLIGGTPYSELPLRDFYRSLIVHEVVHGIMHQNLKRPAASHAVYEYPAYALQLVSLPSNTRNTLLRAIPNRAGPGRLLFSDAILSFDPYFFAVNAYEHFTSSAEGCSLLHLLLEGEDPSATSPTLPNTNVR